MTIRPRILGRPRNLLCTPAGAHRPVQTAFSVLHDAGVILRLRKCRLFSETFDYLGHLYVIDILK